MVRILVIGMLCAAVGPQTAVLETALSRLSKQTAWMLLGDRDVSTHEWRTNVSYDKPGEPEPHALDISVGDRLTLKRETQIAIINYRRDGEANVMVSPANRSISMDDLVGVMPAGSVVEVQDIQLGREYMGLEGVYVRVTPAK